VLSLGYNRLTGYLPSQYGGLAAAQHIRLNGNSLAGGLPPTWGRLGALRELLLGSNNLGGGFPEEWSGLERVQALVFEGNRFSGSLPASWGAMRALQVLDVRGMCGVCGSVPFKQMVRLGLQGSSLGWPCGRGNCSGLPLGFLGQAVIISGKHRPRLVHAAAHLHACGCPCQPLPHMPCLHAAYTPRRRPPPSPHPPLPPPQQSC
jgi:hypothetical protein